MDSIDSIPDNMRERILQVRSMAMWPIDENPSSEAYGIARYFQDYGWRIYPIHDRCERLLGETCYRDIRLIPDDYDILLLLVSPDQLPEAVNAIFNADFIPPIVWMHKSIFDQRSFDRLTDAGIITVMGQDLMELHRKWMKE